MHPAKKTATIRRIGGQSDARANATKPTSSICLDVIDGGDSIEERWGEDGRERREKRFGFGKKVFILRTLMLYL